MPVSDEWPFQRGDKLAVPPGASRKKPKEGEENGEEYAAGCDRQSVGSIL
jgi:hypothetical protein